MPPSIGFTVYGTRVNSTRDTTNSRNVRKVSWPRGDETCRLSRCSVLGLLRNDARFGAVYVVRQEGGSPRLPSP